MTSYLLLIGKNKKTTTYTKQHFLLKMWNFASQTFLLVPHRQHSEDEGTEGGGKEAPPVVPHGEKRGSDLNAEQHPCTPRTRNTQEILLGKWLKQ